ncbi:T9SS type A sorting domain-containing protein [Ferruginibacter lapsinanis]|uniref:T9SS type A sorting domain-containing protein n=1 Tax=Ferruginibacter lapsinanis TaxID=563172 RepID=UPI001E515EA1|nr:T9SS type A sorting domain-containing protein [Ferruginibacter lapsinanis]UEG48561.1 T9SS type A sorting domain-containing protein [Ferruginibacter lapsinanis]
MLTRLLTILILLFGLTFTSFAQNKTAILGDGPAKLIKVYPTPASTAVNFDFQRGFDKSFALQVYNFMGKKVYEVKTNTQHFNLPLLDFYRGIYVYQLRDKNGKILQSGKFQVVK